MGQLAEQLREAIASFSGLSQPPALIGGLALAAHNVVRATRDVDFLVAAEDADRVHQILAGLGYTCHHRSQDAANYTRGEDALDLLYAHRPEARRLLASARERDTGIGRLRVLDAEGLVAFKLQAWVNDPARGRDLDDIRALLRNNAGTLDMVRVRQYFALFEREPLLDELIRDAQAED